MFDLIVYAMSELDYIKCVAVLNIHAGVFDTPAYNAWVFVGKVPEAQGCHYMSNN